MSSREALLNDFAQRVTMREPKIDVLDQDLIEQYMLNIRALDHSLKNKLESKKLLLPELRQDGNESIAIYSDYGGESSDSFYNTYSFLVCGWNHSFAFPEAMSDLREKYSLDEKEISFKDFRYGPIKRSLDEYLTLLDNTVPGILVTVIVDKKIKSMFGDKVPSYVFEELESIGLNQWKPRITEKVLRITHIVAYLVALLSKSGQKILWVTDHDAIAANLATHNKLGELLHKVLALYTENKYNLIGYATPFQERSLAQLDFLSCADIAAGSVEHYFTRKSKKPDDFKIKSEADKVLSWLGYNGISLKKHTVIMEKNKDGSINMGEVEFTNESLKNPAQEIPVRVRYKI